MADVADLRRRFLEVVTEEDELRQVSGEPHVRAIEKVVDRVDEAARSFIAHAPFVFIASGGQGDLDVSPKGDPAGFVRVLDDRTLAVPDRLGNRRFDTFRNILRDPAVALIFIVPGITYTLRVSGRAIIVRDAELRETMAVNGKAPDHVLVVGVEHVFTHCPKCMIRSRLWEPGEWPDTSSLPTFAEALSAHAKLTEPIRVVEESIETGNRERLY